MTLDEHLVCFMLEKQLTRQKTELALIDFLTCLKYYSDEWLRAKTFA